MRFWLYCDQSLQNFWSILYWQISHLYYLYPISHIMTQEDFYVLLTVHLGIILVNDQTEAQFFFYMFISILYMLRANSCSSSGESVVSTQQLVCVTLCRWPSSMQVGKKLPDLHTRRSPTQSDTYQTLYCYNWFSWWWARGCSKHIEDWNKHIGKEWRFKLVIYNNWTSGLFGDNISVVYILIGGLIFIRWWA
jgi:hypothetical protein